MRNSKTEWFGNIKADLLAGIVVAIALIPEAIGFSIIAGVNPMIGLYASFCIAIVTSIFGGRPGMISAATGAMALVLTGLVKNHGIEYMLAATVLTGLIQMILGYLKIGNLLKFIPRPVMLGFVNALAILIFKAQLPYFDGEPMIMYALVALGIFIIYLFPKINKSIPSPLIAIVVITLLVTIFGIDVSKIGDMGNITSELPKFIIPNVPISIETLKIILPYAISLSLVGLVESLLTAQLLDELTDTPSDKNIECTGQGIANIIAGLFGGMAGCAMIGQSVININSGGRGRLSTFTSGIVLMILIIVLNTFVVQIPIAALVAVMIVVSISTFNWESLKRLNKVPKSDAFVMFATIFVVLLTHNLAYGVILGIILSAISFAAKISEISIKKYEDKDNVKYVVKGQLFFASTLKFINSFDYTQNVECIDIDLSKVKIWDESAVDAIDKVVIKFYKNGIKTNLFGMSEPCLELIDKMAVHNKPGGLEMVSGH